MHGRSTTKEHEEIDIERSQEMERLYLRQSVDYIINRVFIRRP
jgi:hypothetical protein